MRPTFYQRDCVEGDTIDLRQARSILKQRPDIVLFEMPAGRKGPAMVFNKYPPEKKPLKKARKIIEDLKHASQIYPYALSDVATWENITRLWSEGHDVLTYEIDVPDQLRRTYQTMELPYSKARRDWTFWVYLYLREHSMAENVRHVLRNYNLKNQPIVAVFLQSIHWKHVRFLLKRPSRKAVWKYYFGRFPELQPNTFEQDLKREKPFLHRWWKKSGLKL